MEGSDLSAIPNEVVRAALRQTIETLLDTNKCKINVTSASQAGGNNFIGIVYRITFCKVERSHGALANEKNPCNLHKLILKIAPQNVARRSHFISRPCFLREIYMYEKVLPYLKQFEQSKGMIIDENDFNQYPKCYGMVDSEPNESVMLEDMDVKGFSMIDRFTQEITADHVRLVMQWLGKFHAISFALKDQQPKKFMELILPLKEVFVRTDDVRLGEFFLLRSKSIEQILSNENDGHLLTKVKKLFETEPIKVAADCIDAELTGPAAVITHGDAWQNNIMFRYDCDGKPTEACFIDWQISRCSSPIIDIVYYMFCCTAKELRDAHYDEFLKIYHESLSTHIRMLGSDPEKLFSYNLMQEHLRKFARFGLVLATVLLPMLTSESGGVDMDELASELTTDTKSISNKFITSKSQNKLEKRLRDVIADMVRLEYI